MLEDVRRRFGDRLGESRQKFYIGLRLDGRADQGTSVDGRVEQTQWIIRGLVERRRRERKNLGIEQCKEYF